MATSFLRLSFGSDFFLRQARPYIPMSAACAHILEDDHGRQSKDKPGRRHAAAMNCPQYQHPLPGGHQLSTFCIGR
jgi:hypothetical protein